MARAKKTIIVADQWRQRELPSLDPSKCTGCGRCVAVCPVDCLAMDGRLPWLIRPVDCVSCAVCALVCPTLAIEMNSAE